MDLFETMRSMRAMRRLKPDPVPRDLIARLVEAGTYAPSGGGLQTWAFIAVDDPALKRQIGGHVVRWFDAMLEQMGITPDIRVQMMAADTPEARNGRALNYLVQHMHEVPVILLCCVAVDYPPYANDLGRRTGASLGTQHATIYPAVQNILLACRALGLGSCLTTMQFFFEAELKQLLGVPETMEISALLPIGYPKGKFGPIQRRPVEESLHWNRFRS